MITSFSLLEVRGDEIGEKSLTSTVPFGGWHAYSIGLLTVSIAATVFYYPLAVPYAFGFYLFGPFSISLSPSLVLAVLSLPVLLTARQLLSRDRWVICCMVVYVSAVFASQIIMQSSVRHGIQEMGRVTVPVALAIGIHYMSKTRRPWNIVCVVFGLIWMSNVFSCLVFSRLGGLCGNQNWTAATTIAVAPFAYLFMAFATGRDDQDSATESAPRPGRQSSLNARQTSVSPGGVFTMAVIAGLTALTVYKTSCRASLIALALYAVFRVLEVRSLKTRTAILLAVGILGLAGMRSVSSDWQRFNQSDIRIPLWAGTTTMIADSPWLGHGPGQFRRRFVAYRPVDLERRLGQGANNEHPHNELLAVAASVGVPGMLAWLAFIGVVIFRGRTLSQSEAARFGAITLFGHGMFDKPLEISPSSIVFLLCLAFLLAEQWRHQLIPPESGCPASLFERNLFRCLGLVAVVASIVELHGHLTSQVFHRRAEQLTFAPQNAAGESSDVRQQGYREQQTAILFARDPIDEQFFAGWIAGEILDRPDLARGHLHAVQREEPDFGYVNYLMGRCEFKASLDPAFDKTQRDRGYGIAIDFLTRGVGNHPFATKIQEDLIAALRVSGQNELALAANSELSRVYSDQYAFYCRVHGYQPESLVQRWVKIDPGDVRGKIAEAFKLTDWGMRTQDSRIELTRLGLSLNRVHKYMRSVNFCLPDAAYWNGVAELSTAFRDVTDGADLVLRLSQVKVSKSVAKSFSWPWDVWQSRRGSSFDVACLVAAVCLQHGQPCLLLNDVHEGPLALYRWKDSICWYNTEKQEWNQLARSRWIEMPADERLRAIRGRTANSVVPNVFVFPQEFCHRNRAVSEVVNSYLDQPLLAENPNVTAARAALNFPDFAFPEFSIEPFNQLESDLARPTH